MKTITTSVLAIISLILICSCCTGKNSATKGENVPYTVAKNYFFRNDRTAPDNPKITTKEQFFDLFGMAAFMGKDGRPTNIDFSRQFVIAIVHPKTAYSVQMTPKSIKSTDDKLIFTYQEKVGKEKLTYTSRPVMIVVVDKKCEKSSVVLVKQ